jgi:hypothetical protein
MIRTIIFLAASWLQDVFNIRSNFSLLEWPLKKIFILAFLDLDSVILIYLVKNSYVQYFSLFLASFGIKSQWFSLIQIGKIYANFSPSGRHEITMKDSAILSQHFKFFHTNITQILDICTKNLPQENEFKQILLQKYTMAARCWMA